MAGMDSFDLCLSRKDYYLLAAAVRSFSLVITTHILAGEVDTGTLTEDAAVVPRIIWLARYYNPVNLSWRYYSIFAYRIAAGRMWGNRQLAIINYESHPLRKPTPFIVTEAVPVYPIRRLDRCGFLSSEGLLAFSAGYQGVLAVLNAISTGGVAFLPNITMPLAILGLFRVLVFPWITNKVYVDLFPYPSFQARQRLGMQESRYKPCRIWAVCWFLMQVSLVLACFSTVFAYPAVDLPKQMLQFTVQIFYVYATVSQILFHGVLLWQGAAAWGNRTLFFDHWIYKAQTAGFVCLLALAFVLGVADFIQHDFYRKCV